MKISAESEKLLASALSDNEIDLNPKAQSQLLQYLALMQHWNRVYNLTAITKPQDAVYLHLIDSLVVLPYLSPKKILDVGTGAGLPGIPLAIAAPELQFTLLDKTHKKIRFLTQVIAELKLTNVEIIQTRCEDYKLVKCFDTILARAFSSLAQFAALTAPLVCADGKLIAMKGKFPADELKALPEHIVADTTRLLLKGTNVERHMIQMKFDHSKTTIET